MNRYIKTLAIFLSALLVVSALPFLTRADSGDPIVLPFVPADGNDDPANDPDDDTTGAEIPVEDDQDSDNELPVIPIDPDNDPPSKTPSGKPSGKPTGSPSGKPSGDPTGSPSGKPSGNPTGNPTGTPKASGVEGFVDRLYDKVLGRKADSTGKQYWIDKVMKEGKTGADIAKGFLYSPEFLNKDMDNGAFLEILYNVFFDRASDAGGKQYWLGKMSGGMSKQDVIMGFINSTEWANVCLSYGIPSGGTGIANKTIEPNEKIVAFAERLYTTCLGRKSDANGLRDWSVKLANMKVTGTAAAYGFFFSKEFTDSNYLNDEFVRRLYKTFMDRDPDPAGFNDWMGRLARGATREEVFYGFANSAEFGRICADYGILR